MRAPTLILVVLLLILVWPFVYPDAALALLAELQRRLRRHILQCEGNQAAQTLARRLRIWAAKHRFDADLVESVINAHKQEIIERLGSRYANEILGEPTSLERYQ